MSNDMYMPAFPTLMRTFQVEDFSVQMTLASWVLGAALAQIILGPLSDHYGRRPAFLGGSLIFMVASLICALSPTIEILTVARFFQGMGVACIIPGYAVIHESFHHEQAIKILSVMNTFVITAPMVGPVIGGLLLQWVTWPWLFIILAGIALVAVGGIAKTLPETVQRSSTPFSFSALFKNVFVLVRNTLFIKRTFVFACFYSVTMMWIAISPFWLMEGFHLSPKEFGWAQVPVFGGYMGGALLVRWGIDRLKPQVFVRLGLLITASGAVWLMTLALIQALTLRGALGGMMLVLGGFGLTAAPLTRLIFMSSDRPKGLMSSVFCMLMMLGGFGCVTLVSSLYDTSPLPFIGGILILMGLSLGVFWKDQEAPSP